MYELITFELRWVSEFRRAWFIEHVDYYSSISEIARDYGQNPYRLRYVYRAAYKPLDKVKDPFCFFTHYPKTYYYKSDFPKYGSSWHSNRSYHPGFPDHKIAVFKNDVPVSMVTVYMAALAHYKNLPRDVHGRVINQRRHWRKRHNSAAQMRWPTTKNELVKNDALNCDRDDLKEIGYSGHLLKARKRWIPTAWDDLHTDKGNTWKTHRKKQYRVKN